MTLLAAVGNARWAVLVADRRIGTTVAPLDDESNKLTVLRGPGLRMAVGYTGVAELGSFKTREWLPDRLHQAMRPTGALNLRRFCELATADFARLRPKRSTDLLISIGFIGFAVPEGESRPRSVYGFLGNGRQDVPGAEPSIVPFWELTWLGNPDDPELAYALIGGAFDQKYEARRADLQRLASDPRRPAAAAVAKAVELIQWAALTDARVGAQCSSISIEAAGAVRFGYHTGTPVTTIYTPSIVTEKQVFLGAKLIRLDDGFAAVPRVATRSLCPCGSGKRYGRCHGSVPRSAPAPRFVFGPDGSVTFKVGDRELTSDQETFTVNVPRRRSRRRR